MTDYRVYTQILDNQTVEVTDSVTVIHNSYQGLPQALQLMLDVALAQLDIVKSLQDKCKWRMPSNAAKYIMPDLFALEQDIIMHTDQIHQLQVELDRKRAK